MTAAKKKPSGKKFKWGVRKIGRPADVSYTGPTWKRLGVLDPPERFDTKRDADYWAELLSEENHVGFEPFPFKKEDARADSDR